MVFPEHNKHKECVIATTRKPGQACPSWAERHSCYSETFTFCSSLDKQNTPTTDRAGSVLLSPVLTFFFQHITPDNKDSGNVVAITYPYGEIWEVITQNPTVFHTNNLRNSQVGLCSSSQQSKPPEDSVHQRQCNTVTLTKAFTSSGFFFTVFSSPLLFQAWELTSLFTAELLVDGVKEDCREKEKNHQHNQEKAAKERCGLSTAVSMALLPHPLCRGNRTETSRIWAWIQHPFSTLIWSTKGVHDTMWFQSRSSFLSQHEFQHWEDSNWF